MSSSGVWALVGAVGAGTLAMKAAGPVLLGGRALPERAPAVILAAVVTAAIRALS